MNTYVDISALCNGVFGGSGETSLTEAER